MSHVHAVRRALTEAEAAAFTVVDLNTPRLMDDPDALEALVSRPEAAHTEALLFSIGGNYHNQIGLISHPQPYTLDPAGEGRFIPESLMIRMMEVEHGRFLLIAELIAALFPGVPRVVIAAPPPVGDHDHIRRNPGIFRAKLAQGIAPDALRLRLHALQVAEQRRHATWLGAAFLPPPAGAVDGRGLLAHAFMNADPTHGNPAYGRLVLDQIDALLAQVAA